MLYSFTHMATVGGVNCFRTVHCVTWQNYLYALVFGIRQFRYNDSEDRFLFISFIHKTHRHRSIDVLENNIFPRALVVVVIYVLRKINEGPNITIFFTLCSTIFHTQKALLSHNAKG